MDLSRLPREYQEALRDLPENKKEELLRVLLEEFPEDYNVEENKVVEINNKFELLDKLDYKVEEIGDIIKIRFFLNSEYVAFAKIYTISNKKVNLEEFLTSNYNTTFDKDLPEEMKQEYKLINKINISDLGTNVLVKLFIYLLNEFFVEVELVSSRGSIGFYEKVLNRLASDKLINWEILNLPEESKFHYRIHLKDSLLDLDS